MKSVLVLLITVATQMAFAAQGILDGRSYCRTVVSSGMFGQPVGESQHCIWFANGAAFDNANTFFGNPPDFADYVVQGNKLQFGSSEYQISGDGKVLTVIKGSAIPGTLLVLK